MVVRQISDIQGPRKQFLEELLGQRLGDDEQVYILVYAGQEEGECTRSPAPQLPADGSWTSGKNARRTELIDKQIDGSISREERAELDFLQQQFRAFRQQVAPLPIEKATRLHQELLEKKRRHEETQG